jgi:rhodanese-related sulfurtransferase
MDFINWFSKNKIKNIGFEDMKNAIKDEHYIINTLPSVEQDCLIYGTIAYNKEEHIINRLIETNDKDRIIIIYGKHSADDSPQKKYNQLINYGFKRVYIYTGGLFEWLLLQDIYSFGEFPTTIICKDILKYRVTSLLQFRIT